MVQIEYVLCSPQLYTISCICACRKTEGQNEVQEQVQQDGQQNVQKSLVTKETLKVMVDEDQLKLLQHPVVHAHLKKKWDYIGRPLYFIQLIVYTALILVPPSVMVVRGKKQLAYRHRKRA